MAWSASLVDSLIDSIHKCRHTRNLFQAQLLHVCIYEHQLESHAVLGNHLVTMFVDCGGLSEAQHVFNKLAYCTEHSWSSLISGHADYGDPNQAFHFYRMMQQDSAQPSSYTYVALLKASSKLKDSISGQNTHTETVKRGLDNNLFIGNTLVDVYGKSGLVAETQYVFEKLPTRDVVTWTALISSYAEHGMGELVLDCLEQMLLEGVSPVDATFVCSLKACGGILATATGQKLHSEIVIRGLDRELFVGSTLVDMYGKCGLLDEALQVFDHLPVRNEVSWNALIAGYVDHGLGDEALSFYKQMQLEDITATDITFACTLKACGSSQDIARGQMLCIEIARKGLERDPFIGNSMVDMYAKCGLLEEAHKILDQLPIQNVVSWNALITGYAERGAGKEVLHCYGQMQRGCVSPDAVTFACTLKGSGIMRTLAPGQEMHTEIINRGLERESHIGNTLVDMYAKCSSLVDAQSMFDRLPVRDAVSWAVLISGYADHDFDEEVHNCFKKMQLDGVSADAVTLVRCLKACGNIGALDTGREVHIQIRKLGVESDLFVGNTLVDMYGKCGSLVEGREVFDRLPVRDVVSWNAMIKAHGENHEGNMAVQYFEQMQQQAVKPDAITFTCLLAVCSHASLLDQGQKFFKMMLDHGFEPTSDHYTCLVDLYARSGLVWEADNIAELIQYLPLKEISKVLLTACKVYGKVELGLSCFQQLVHVNKEDASAYMLIADLYASAGRWSDANKIEEKRKHVGAKKKLASVSIEVNKKLHEFVVGDSQVRTTLKFSRSFSLRMKNEGYVPILDLVLRNSLVKEGSTPQEVGGKTETQIVRITEQM